MPLSVSGRPNNISDRDKGFFDPHTPDGILLDSESLPLPRVHECGAMPLDGTWSYRDVCSPFWRAYYNREGGASVRVGKTLWPLGPRHVLLIPEEVRYDCVPRAGVRHLWIHFSLEGGRAAALGGPWEIPLDPVARQSWKSLLREAGRARRGGARILRHACAAALLGALGGIDDAGVTATSQRLRELLFWVERTLDHPPSLDEMAARAGMGRRSFIRWFRKETGSPPITFLVRRRVREACRLLRFGTASIEQIADATGFANRHHFTRVFAAETGMGPAAYRKGR